MIGALLGNRYELLEKIGEGGMAQVYKAKCHILNRFVAIKILKNEFNEDSTFIEKFRREAFAAASLTHPNIVQIYDVGRDNNLNYIVFEFVDGPTLKDVIRKYNNLDNQAILNYSIQICKALMCAHKNGIIHRDIKPHNILVTNEGTLKVTDFGIAKAATSSTVTSGEKILGTPYYLSPEQARGDSVDTRSDLYSFGIVMYEMCAGVVPFVGDNLVTVVLKHVQEAPKPPIEMNAEITESLNNIVLRLLQKSPQERYQEANDVLTDLRKVQNSQVVFFNPDENKTSILDPATVSDYAGNTSNLENTVDENLDQENAWKWRVIWGIVIVLAITVGIVIGKTYVDSINGSINTSSNSTNSTVEEEIIIPDIIEETFEEAENILSKLGLKIRKSREEPSNTVPKGRIIEIDGGNVGDKTKEGTTISVVVSSGKEKVTIPEVKDKGISEAKAILQERGISVATTTYTNDLSVPEHVAIRTDPPAGTLIDADNQQVTLYVSSGPEIERVTIPDYIGQEVNKVVEEVTSKGLIPKVKQYPTSDPNLNLQVKSTYPFANTEMPVGEEIEIVYYQYEEPEDTTQDTTQNTTEQNTTNVTVNTTENTTNTTQQNTTSNTTNATQSSSSLNTTNTTVKSVNATPIDEDDTTASTNTTTNTTSANTTGTNTSTTNTTTNASQ